MRRPPGRVIVVGGGIGGMAASLLLADRGFAVDLIEAGPRPGAGWHSVETPAGRADLGIRVPRESGDAWADALVFHADPALAWHRLGPRPREGHVARGRLQVATGCLDVRGLEPLLLAAARAEMRARAAVPDPGAAAPNLAARLATVFGPTLLEAALRPACRSLLGAEPEALAWHAAEARLPARLVLADREETDALRGIGLLGARLADPRAADAPATGEARSYLYPREGGIGRWVAALEAALARAGVALRTGCRIAALRMQGARVAGATLQDGTELPCDHLVLAAAPRALPLPGLPPVPEATLPVAARLLTVAGGAPPPLDWLASYDPATTFLRLGFPDRLEGRAPLPGAPWRIIAETRVELGTQPDTGALAAELAWLGLLPSGARVTADAPVGQGRFAVETAQAAAAREAALAALRGIANLAVLRPAAGGHALAQELVGDAARLAGALTGNAAAPATVAA